jgi:hypothetical protein
MGSFPDAAAAPEVPADPLSFLVQSRTNANASSVNRLVIELLADEGFALVGPAEAPKSRLTLHHKRRRDEKCAVCAQSEAASTFCAVCGCAVCLKKITTVALHCPECVCPRPFRAGGGAHSARLTLRDSCSERFHVACFGSATECPGCVLVNQSCRSPSPPSREEEAACMAYLSESKFDPAKELAFRRLLQSAATPALARVFKALQHARNALLDELRASAGGGGAQASTHARGDIAL